MLSLTHQLFGQYPGATSTVAQDDGESLAVATYKRKLKGGTRTGRFGYTAIPTGAFTGSMTVWYSHMNNPDPATEAHWWQDTDIGTVTLTSGTTVGKCVGNAVAPWIRFNVTVATGTMLLSLWVENGE